jgi:hypothetical protein
MKDILIHKDQIFINFQLVDSIIYLALFVVYELNIRLYKSGGFVCYKEEKTDNQINKKYNICYNNGFGGLVVSMLASGNVGGLVVSMLASPNVGGRVVSLRPSRNVA